MKRLYPSKLVIGGAIGVAILAACNPSLNTDGSENGRVTAGNDVFQAESLANAQLPKPCEGGGITTGDEVAVSKEVPLRGAPDKSAPKLINRKLSDALGHEEPITLDQTERLREICRQASWAKVQVAEPDWLTDHVGWVPVSELRQIARDATGKRQYVEGDFSWDEDTERFRTQLVAGVNRIVRENARCDTVDPGTLSLSGSRSTKDHPVFFITCNSGGTPFNLWFSPEQATSKGHSFAAIRNVSRGDGLVACQRAAKEAAINPQTVDFSVFLDVAFVPYPNGNSRLLSTFTAKNSFGVESKFRVQCFFEGSTLTERSIELATN